MQQIFNLLRNRVDSRYHLNLGWFAVRNRSSKETLDESSFEVRDKEEIELFENGKWKEAVLSPSYKNSIDPNVLGIKNLKHTLQQNLYKRVKENFPLLKIKMRELKNKYHEQLQAMGDPRDNPRDQRVYLSDIQSRYEVEVERSLNGNYRSGLEFGHPSRLRYHVKGFNDAFGDEMLKKALKYTWQLLDRDPPESQGTSGEEPHAGIFQWIDQTWNYHVGSEPRDDVPWDLKKVLFKEQIYSWEARTGTYVKEVEQAITNCNTELFETACGDDTLRAKIREKLELLETKAFDAAKVELQQIIGDLDYIDSWHPDFKHYKNELQIPRMSRQVSQIDQFNLGESRADPVQQYHGFIAYNNRVYAVHDWMYAYWRIVLPRFIDNVIIQVIERHLLGRKGPLRLFNRHWINHLSDDELKDLVGEDEVTVNKRKAIKEKLRA